MEKNWHKITIFFDNSKVFFFVPNSKRSFTASCCILLRVLCYGNWETFAVHIVLSFVSFGRYLRAKYVCGEQS